MKDKKILFGIIMIFIFLLSVGLTYAYFTATTIGQGSDVTTSVGTLRILYTDGPEIVANGIQPGWTTTKTIKITNTGTLKAYYSLVWASLTNEITNDELLFSATCTSNVGSCDGLSSQAVDIEEAVAYGKPLLQNEEHTYIITFLFKETGSAQNYNQDKVFNGVLNVIDAIESNTIVGNLLDSNGNPINGATVEMHSILRTGKTDAKGYFEIRGVEVGNHEITVKNSSDVTIATDSLSIISGANLAVDNKNITSIADKGVLNTSIKLSNTNTIQEIKVYPSLKDKILTDNTVYADNVSSTYVSSASGINFQAKSTLINGQGLYTNNKLEDGKNKYFRGGSFCEYTNYDGESFNGTFCTLAGGTWSSTNKSCSLNTNRSACTSLGFTYHDLGNNVTFAGHKWKIIRIDENNNIRMILADDSVDSSLFNTASNDNAYVGYMYGASGSSTYNLTHENTNNSIIKAAVDSWYNTNLLSYSSSIEDAGYCSDRTLDTGLGYGTNDTTYKGHIRNFLNESASPRLKISDSCSNTASDLFTTASNTIGNKSLTYPAGLITVDEARYAGMVLYGANSSRYNTTNYLKFNGWYWTMSPVNYTSSYESSVYNIAPIGYFTDNSVNSSSGLRVSISLKPNTVLASGTGTYDDPYVVE